jgi:trans-aconitate 2-methyltransferase
MPTWDSAQYLQFDRERTQPAVDLAMRIAIDMPHRVVDLGCGPGNSTAVLAQRWPAAEITGIDNSESMLETARRNHPQWAWQFADIGSWKAATPFDVVFTSAALQWVPDHATVLPRLLAQVAPFGALAMQVPDNLDAPPHRLMRELAASDEWRTRFALTPREWSVEEPGFYYDVLSPLAARLELWRTEYQHPLADLEGVIAWYQGSGLRPWLEALPDQSSRAEFLAAYRSLLAPWFPARADGRVLFPFRRLFVIAYR